MSTLKRTAIRPNPRKIIFLEPTSAPRAEARRRALDAIALKRRRPELSLSAAAKQSGTTLKTVRRYAGTALETRSGRLDVSSRDRIPRNLRFLTAKGQVVIRVTNSRDASRIARYNNAVRKYLMTGDTAGLQPYSGKSIRAGGATYEFVTDPAALNRLARAGEVHVLDIYAPAGGAL